MCVCVEGVFLVLPLRYVVFILSGGTDTIGFNLLKRCAQGHTGHKGDKGEVGKAGEKVGLALIISKILSLFGSSAYFGITCRL